MRIAAILVAAGSAQRMGAGTPKQFRTLGGRAVIDWSLEVLSRHRDVSRVVIVLPPSGTLDWQAPTSERIIAVPGGATRTRSVRAGLAALSAEPPTHVLIHDAARPGLTAPVIDRLVSALEDVDAAAPALPVVDALRRTGESIARDGLQRIQTPQAFRFEVIEAAMRANDGDAVDDLTIAERAGARIALVEGDEALAKVTYCDDLLRMERLLVPAGPVRVGTGFDVHAFTPGSHVVLCGVEIAHEAGLAGHSDADVGWHALCDAILGACALGDIGDHFPPGDPQWKGAPSERFLVRCISLAAGAGYRLASCDITLVCEAPKIKPHRDAMRARTAAVTGLPLSAVSLKATTTEGLGFAGRREGIAAQAVAVLSPAPGVA